MTNGGSADRPDRGRRSGCRPGCRGGWRARRDGSQEPQRPRLFGPRFWLLLLGLLDDLPFLPTGTGPARCGRLQTPRGAPATFGERFGQAIVRHEALGHGRDQLSAGRVEEADARHGSRSRQRGGLTSGRSTLSSIFDRASTQSDQIELANLWQAAVEGARPCNRPEAGPGLIWWFVVEPPAGIEPATPSLPRIPDPPPCHPASS
jgi:hypothetical protein